MLRHIDDDYCRDEQSLGLVNWLNRILWKYRRLNSGRLRRSAPTLDGEY